MEKEKKPQNKINAGAHALLTAAVGCYLFVIAYQIYTGGQRDGMEPALAIALGVFFALAGLGVLFYAFLLWRRSRKKN